MPPKAASELTQVESLFLAIAARLFTAAITFSAHPPDDGQQAYLVRKVKDEIILVGNQFKKFMGDPSKHTKKPCMHPIIQIMSEEWKAAEAEQRMPEWGIFTLDHIPGYCHAQWEAHSDWHPDLSTLDLSNYLQGLQNHRQWWVTGLPPPQGDSDVAMEGLAAPAQPSVPVPPVSLMMPDAPAVTSQVIDDYVSDLLIVVVFVEHLTKGKRHALPPAGASDPHGTPPTPIAQPTPPYDFRNTRQHPVVQLSQGTSTTTQSDEFEDCMLSDMIADMDSTPSAPGRVSDSSLPCVQVDDVSPPPPAQPRRLDVKPLIATGDSCKINNAECVSQINQTHLTFKCVYCAERRRPCIPAASWAQPVIRVMKLRNLDLPPGIEASYGPLAVGTSSIYPGEELESRIDSLEAKMDHAILVLNALAIPFQDISNPHHLVDHLPPAITPYLHLELPLHPWGFLIRHPNPNHVPAPGQSAQYIAGEAALCPLHTSKEEALEARAAHLLSRNEIYICLIIDVVPHPTHRTHV
ncbi:hypothetical protein EI94DRAFT_1705159 [Lactarius quietus]|nr:hypothetical protein EI94DRAFT_1705159 [Lactarius quietus]